MARFSAWGPMVLVAALGLHAAVIAAPASAKPAPASAKPAPQAQAGKPPATATLRWETLPAPGPLPEATSSGMFATDDVKLWYATFGEGAPVVLLHGGLGNSAHYGDVVTALVADERRVIVMDSRGHGRSTRSKRGVSYKQMADDVVALLDHLAIERAAIVGWSDGGATALDVAIRYPERINKLFVIGTNYALDGAKGGSTKSKTFPEYFARCRREYARLSPDPKQLGAFLWELRAMWGSQPTFTDDQIRGIATPTLVALGEHDEVVRLDHVKKLAKLLPHGKLAVLSDVSHFAMWQDPEAFLAVLRAFLDEKPAPAKKKRAASRAARRGAQRTGALRSRGGAAPRRGPDARGARRRGPLDLLAG